MLLVAHSTRRLSIPATISVCSRTALPSSVRLAAHSTGAGTMSGAGDSAQLEQQQQKKQQADRRSARVAVGQMTAVGDQLHNFETCRQLAQVRYLCERGVHTRPQSSWTLLVNTADRLPGASNTHNEHNQAAKAAHACMLFLPECFSFIGTSQPESLAKAEPLEGPVMGRYRQLARCVSGCVGVCLALLSSVPCTPLLQPHLNHATNCGVCVSCQLTPRVCCRQTGTRGCGCRWVASRRQDQTRSTCA
jgi:hypothetical protein